MFVYHLFNDADGSLDYTAWFQASAVK